MTVKRALLKKTPIGKSKSLQVELDEQIIRLTILSKDGETKAGFSYEEWENFVDGVKQANASIGPEED